MRLDPNDSGRRSSNSGVWQFWNSLNVSHRHQNTNSDIHRRAKTWLLIPNRGWQPVQHRSPLSNSLFPLSLVRDRHFHLRGTRNSASQTLIPVQENLRCDLHGHQHAHHERVRSQSDHSRVSQREASPKASDDRSYSSGLSEARPEMGSEWVGLGDQQASEAWGSGWVV